MVVVLAPDILAVPGRAGTAVHADAPDGGDLAQGFEIHAEILVGFVHIAVAGRQRLVMVADFVAQGGNLPDDFLVPTLRDGPEIVDPVEAQFCLDLRRTEGIPGAQVHVVTEGQRPETIGLQNG